MSLEPSVELRPATAQDAAMIRDLARAAYAKWVPVIGREPLPMIADYAQALVHHRFDLLYVGDCLGGLIETVREPACLLIENVAVLPTHQGKGFGRLLMSHAEEIARSEGYDKVRLYTNKAFAENRLLYESLGYSVDKEEPFRGGFTVHMSKQVKAGPSRNVP
jgi:GNAT superfamily N-acetyltransferase